MFIWYLSTFIVYISYQSCDEWLGLRLSGSDWHVGCRGWRLGIMLQCFQHVQRVYVFPLNLWFRHELKIPLGWGIIMDYWRSIGSYVLAFTNWIGFTRSFEAFEWHSYISVIMIFWKKIYICIYIYIYIYIYLVFSQTAETGLTIASSLEAVRSTPSPTRVVGLVAARKWLLTFKATIISRYVYIDLHDLTAYTTYTIVYICQLSMYVIDCECW